MLSPIIYVGGCPITFLASVPANPLQSNTLFVHTSTLTRQSVTKVLKIFIEHGALAGTTLQRGLEGIIAPTSASIVKETLLPSFTRINAAGGIILSPSQRYLFIHRNGFWDLPKGKVEKGETLAETALREVKEETGIGEVTLVRELVNTWHIYYPTAQSVPVLKKTRWFLMRATEESTLVPQREEGIDGAYWLSYKQVLEILPSAYRTIADLFNILIATHCTQ